MEALPRKYVLSVVLTLALVASVVAPALAAPLAPPIPEDVEAETWIVTLVDGARPDIEGRAAARSVNARAERLFERAINGFTFRGSEQAANRLRKNPQVSSVVANGNIELADTEPPGIRRIEAAAAHQPFNGNYRGNGARIIIIDSGADIDHPDLLPNLDLDNALNCVSGGTNADDDLGHGTHVAGIAAAASNAGGFGFGVVGVAPEATIVPIKSFDATGNATTLQVLCGIEHAITVAGDGIPTVVNMSFAETGGDSICDDVDTTDVLHEAICNLSDTGAIAVAAAGNAASNASTTQPALFAETIGVSAISDLDGLPGGLADCVIDWNVLAQACDDEFASFSNYGSVVDVTAPGSIIKSTVPGGGHGEKSGTSMAAPHVAGVVAQLLALDPNLTLDDVRGILQETGECPDGSVNGSAGNCAGASWPGDPDGIAEPLVNSLRAGQLIDTSVRWLSPAPTGFLGGVLPVVLQVFEDVPGSTTVEWRVDSGAWQPAVFDSGSGFYEASWDTATVEGGAHTLEARATLGEETSDSAFTVIVSAYASSVLADGAFVLWRLGDASGTVAVDAAGSVNGTYAGSPSLGAAGLIASDADTAVTFDGVNDSVKVPDKAVVNTAGPYLEKTIELWFRADDVTSRQVLFEQGAASRGLSLYLDQGSVYFAGWNTINDDVTTPWGPVWVSADVTEGTIYHVVLVFDQPGDRLEGYLNGVSIGSVSGVGKLFTHNGDGGLGSMNDGVRFHDGADTNKNRDYFFTGTIDEAALYATALTDTQIANHHDIGGTDPVGAEPVVAVIAPSEGATVSGDVAVSIDASDVESGPGFLTVQWRVDSGPWQNALFNPGSGLYEASWDTLSAGNGSRVLKVRATDSDGRTGTDQVTVTVANVTYASSVLADGAFVLWRLGDASGTVAVDAAGSVNGTYAGSPSLGAAGLIASDADTAVTFDGVNDSVKVPDKAVVNTAGPYLEKTIELWFRADDVTSRQVLFEQGAASRGLSLYLDQGSVYFAGWNTINDDVTTPWGPVWVSADVTEGTIYHVVLVFDQPGDRLEGYLNGVSIGSVSGVGKLFTHNGDGGLGSMNDGVRFHDGADTNKNRDYFFTGTIDEAALYATALTDTQIANHASIGGIGGL